MKTLQIPFSISTIKAIIGLGNPGPRYMHNRHNIGFRIVDELVQQAGGAWRTNDQMMITEIQLTTSSGQQAIIVIKPQTYMNSSGNVISFLQKKGIKPEEILVIHDELEKEFGKTQLRLGGSARGHNGLKSLIVAMGENFWRLRFGIDRPTNKEEVPNYVLTDFRQEEEELLPCLIGKASKIVTNI